MEAIAKWLHEHDVDCHLYITADTVCINGCCIKLCAVGLTFKFKSVMREIKLHVTGIIRRTANCWQASGRAGSSYIYVSKCVP